MAEESKINSPAVTAQPISEHIGANGMSLPAVPIAQLAKFHTTAKKGDKTNKKDPHEESSNAFSLAIQRKADPSADQTTTTVKPFRPPTELARMGTGTSVTPFQRKQTQRTGSHDMPIVQRVGIDGVAQLEGESDDGGGGGEWHTVTGKRGKGGGARPAPVPAPASFASPNPFAALAEDEGADEEETTAPSPETLEGLAAGLSTKRAEWSGNDDLLLRILKGAFEANWFKARACLTMGQWPANIDPAKRPSHDDGVLFMNALVDMRWRVWKKFTTQALGKMQGAVRETANNPAMAAVKDKLLSEGEETDQDKLTKTLDPVGSMAVTSDIDLSLGGSNTEIAVGLLNKEFRDHFGVPYDPGTVFDINVYASDWIHGVTDTSTAGTNEKEYTPNPEVKDMSKAATDERDERMEVWSLVKVRRNMEADEWDSYTKQTLGVLAPGPERTKMKNKLDQAAFEYDKFRDAVTSRMKKNDAKLKADESKLTFSGGKSSAFANNAEYEESAAETRASNEIYAEKLVEIKAIRLRLNELMNGPVKHQEEIDNLGKVLGDRIAEALTYANEVYATEGAVQHTVLDQGAGKKLDKLKAEAADERKKDPDKQNPAIVNQENLVKVKYKLRKELFLQSVNENVGDALHSLHAYHHLPYYAAYRAGKYLSRLVEATGKLIEDEESMARVPFYEEIKHVGTTAMSIKSNKVEIGGQSLEGDPAIVEKNDLFKSFDHSKVDALRTKIIAFGAKVPGIFNEKKVEATGE